MVKKVCFTKKIPKKRLTIKSQIESEINFLTGFNMRELVREADIGSCHEKYHPIIRRVKKLRKLLEDLK